MLRPVFSLLLVLVRGLGAESTPSWPRHILVPNAAWQLDLPDREPFEASGLFRLASGELLTISDRGPEVFRVRFSDSATTARLEMWPEAFPHEQLERVAPTRLGRYDIEGITADDQGRLYLCEESQRWILRWDPASNRVDRLAIDWAPVRQYFSRNDRNASFEGVAVGNGILYVANERSQGRIIEVDLDRLSVAGSFEVRTLHHLPWDTHYSDLAWFDGRLYVLCRDSRTVLRVDPSKRAVEAEYDFSGIEQNPEWRYRMVLPLVGNMEGLALDRQYFWLATDNNNLPRENHPDDRRPTLFRCPWPETATSQSP